jgi:hypothetical protein
MGPAASRDCYTNKQLHSEVHLIAARFYSLIVDGSGALRSAWAIRCDA